MTRITKRILLTLALLSILIPLCASAFTIKSIQFRGLQLVRESTALSYVPVKVGQQYTPALGDKIIRALYKTTFFNSIRVTRSGDTLVIVVHERPTIGLINITGNKAIKRKNLDPILKKMGIVVGNTFDESKVHKIVVGLEHEYGRLGYRAVDVTTQTKKTPHNTVALYIKVHEGVIAEVKEINFIGNHAFSSGKLRSQFKLQTSGIFTLINHHDRYSKIKLDMDLQSLRNFYLNKGYLHFKVVKSDVRFSKGHSAVNITITVSEGSVYTVSGSTISGNALGHKKALIKLITLKKGDVAARQSILNIDKSIETYLGNRGYALAHVLVKTREDVHKHTIFLNFRVVPGGRIYIRHINFYGNQRTSEEVLRRQLRQMEGAVYSGTKIKESTHRLKQLPYVDPYALKMVVQPIPGMPDKVDLGYHIKEKQAGKASIQAGYSDAQGVLYGASIAEANFLGTGNAVSIGFQNSSVLQNYFFNYFNPYYTINGVSMGINTYYNRAKFDPKFNQQSYVMDSYGFDLTYGFPLDEHNTVTLGAGYANTAISHVDTSTIAPSTLAFLKGQNAQTYNLFKLKSSWIYDSLDQVIFPSDGWNDTFSAEVGLPVVGSSLSYYKVTNNVKGYIPFGHSGFIIKLVNFAGYGNGYGDTNELPFFLNYYAGGLQGGIPGYAPNSLGPKNTSNDGSSIGGNLVLTGGIHFILPNFFNNHVRVALTLDAGNVFQTPRNSADVPPQIIDNDRFTLKNFRSSAGVLVTWYSFIPISVSFAIPLNKQPGDDTQEFQFALSAGV